jgi:hypothetical protein
VYEGKANIIAYYNATTLKCVRVGRAMTSKDRHRDLVEAILIIGFGLSTFIVFNQIPVQHIIDKLQSAISIIIVVGLLVFIGSVYSKKLLIDAFAQQITDEISRMNISTPTEVSEKMLLTTAQFTIDGLASINKERSGVLFEGGGNNEAEVLAKVAQEVVDFNQRKFGSFLFERTTLRWAIDGLEALIGDHKSIEVAWAKGNRYLNRFLPENNRNELPWIPSYMKLLGLPHNFHARNFEEQVKKAMARKHPKGYLSLAIASTFFPYRYRLRLFNLQGEDAWREIIRFKADTLDFEALKRTFPPRR